MKNSNNCPCQSGLKYTECCAPYLSGQSLPSTPEALMRSRYTAYSLADIAYIERTMQGPALNGFNPETARQWALQIKWLGLKIISAPPVKGKINVGYVEFLAFFEENARQRVLHEKSKFKYIDGKWFYHSGISPKFNRNSPCFCESGKKLKNCCLEKISI